MPRMAINKCKSINWNSGTTQHVYIMINDSRLKTEAVIHPHDWLVSYLEPNGPLYYVSWRTDFIVLSFGLLGEYTEKEQVDMQIQ